MAFLVQAAGNGKRINPDHLKAAARDKSIVWFSNDDPGLGGSVCLSPLAVRGQLQAGDQIDLHIVGRIRLDRREELKAALSGVAVADSASASDADLCLEAFVKWGRHCLEHIHGDFAFVIYDAIAREALCGRDRFGIRTLAWSEDSGGFWLAGSMQDLAFARRDLEQQALDPTWITDFLTDGVCSDPARSVYAAVHRLPPAHGLAFGPSGKSLQRYWTLAVAGPLKLESSAAYVKEFHARLDLAMRERLPEDRLGILMSGGLDSSTLAAKAKELSGPQLEIFARTLLVGGQSDPEAEASARVAAYLGVAHTRIDAERLRFNPDWWEKPATTAEPSMAVMRPSDWLDEVAAMRAQATCWFHGEGPDNALTFEWHMQIRWLLEHREWSRMPGVVARYLATKSAADWVTTARAMLGKTERVKSIGASPRDWVRGCSSWSADMNLNQWRPMAHRSFASALWPSMFEGLDADYASCGIEWRHPFMDLRVLEFLLATPPIPWARRKRLIRKAMEGRLPSETLKRSKTPLHREDFRELLRQQIGRMPMAGDAVAPYIHVDRLPTDPERTPDIHALARVSVLQHWLTSRHVQD